MPNAPDPDEPLATVLRMLHDTARDRSTSVEPVPGGMAFLNRHYPFAHDHNRILISGPTTAELAAVADDVMGRAGLHHRLIEAYPPARPGDLVAALAAEGYSRQPDVLMAVTGAPSDPPRPPASPVIELDLAERVAVATAGWRQDHPDWDQDTVGQLGRRIETMKQAARVIFLATRGPDGGVTARVDLYLRDGVGQVEEVMTDPAHRGQGLASALVLDAVARARDAGAGIVFLIADADDWPQHLYRRLGFTDIGRTTKFSRY